MCRLSSAQAMVLCTPGRRSFEIRSTVAAQLRLCSHTGRSELPASILLHSISAVYCSAANCALVFAFGAWRAVGSGRVLRRAEGHRSGDLVCGNPPVAGIPVFRSELLAFVFSITRSVALPGTVRPRQLPFALASKESGCTGGSSWRASWNGCRSGDRFNCSLRSACLPVSTRSPFCVE